jgi:hypothetical protein
MDPEVLEKKERKSGIPTGNAGEYLVVGELLRRASTRSSLTGTPRATTSSPALSWAK